MSTSCSTIQFGFDSTINSFRNNSQINKRNKYASPKMKILMTQYKDKYRFQREKLLMPLSSDLSTHFQTVINFSSDSKKNKNNNNNNNSNNNEKQKTSLNLKNCFNQIQNKNKTQNKFKFHNFSIKKRKKSYFRISSRNYINEYINNIYSRKEISNSIYRNLSEKKNSYLKTMNDYINKIKEADRKIVIGLSPFPKVSKNLELKIPEINNLIITRYNKSFNYYSIGERYERHMNELLKLKHVMKNLKGNDRDNKNKYFYRMLCNYLAQNGIFEKKYYNETYLSNFKDFLDVHFEINPEVPYKEFLFNILKGNYDKYVNNPMDSNNSSLAFYENHFKNKTINNNFEYYTHHKTHFDIQDPEIDFDKLF